MWLRDERGVHAHEAVSPAAWAGQRPCIVGPFSNVRCAQDFMALRVRGRVGARVFPAGPAYWVELVARRRRPAAVAHGRPLLGAALR